MISYPSPRGKVAKHKETVPLIPAEVKIRSRSGQFIVLVRGKKFLLTQEPQV